MGFRDTLRQAKQAMNVDAIKQGLDAARNPPTQEEIDASLETLTPEQRAAYDANMAQVNAGKQASLDAEAEIRVLDGPAGDFLFGTSIADQGAAWAAGGVGAILSSSKTALGQSAKGIYGGDLAPHEKDRELAGRIMTQERAERDAARAPFLAADRPPLAISRLATRGATQLDELILFLQSSGLAARPDLVYGVYRVPDRISVGITPSSERARVVEWDIVHAELPGAPVEAPVTPTYFSAQDHWVARRKGEPSILDEDLGLAHLARAGIGPEGCLGIARFGNFVRPKDRWYALGNDEDTENYLVPLVEGVVVLQPGSDDGGTQAQMAAEAPLLLGAEVLAGTHSEVLNWAAVARAVHPRLQHPPASPSPFPYLPSTPQELLRAYLEIVGLRPTDCYSAQVTIDEPYALTGRIAMGTSTIGSAQPSADGKDRRRMHGARRIVVTYRDRPEYAEGRERWNHYQHDVLLAHLERATHVRRPVVPDELPQNALLRAGARALNIAEKASSIGEWEPPPPYRYCWPVIA